MSGQSYISGGGVEGCCCFATISTSEVGVIERFGKFDRFVEVRSRLGLVMWTHLLPFLLYFILFYRLVALQSVVRLKFLRAKLA
jgi:hypothetical protein